MTFPARSRASFSSVGDFMSSQSTHNIACPRCHCSQAVELYDAINVGEQPTLREELMANRLNVVACVACGFQFRVDKPLLYHDPARGFLIWLQPASERDADAAEREFRETSARLQRALPASARPPALHLVLDRIELVERIFLLEAGLDPRLIEYIKHNIYTKNISRLNPAQKRLLFDAQDSDAENLVFVVQDIASRKLETVIHYRREAYQALAEMFDDDAQTAQLLDLFPGPYFSARRLLLAMPRDEEG